MKFLFWLALLVEGIVSVVYFYKAWLVYAGKSGYIESYHADLYGQYLVPATLMALLVVGGLLARFWFDAPKIATYIVISPAIVMVIAFIGMIVASMFIKDWR